MSKYSKGLFSALVFGVVLSCSGMVLGQVNLVAPEVEVIEGDRQVEIFWNDPEPEDLVYFDEPTLGTVAFPWMGNAGVSSAGTYEGACDWTFSILVSLVLGHWELSWREVLDWETGAEANRNTVIEDLGVYYDLSHGMKVKIDEAGIFNTDLLDWTGPEPVFGGLFIGGDQAYPDSAVMFTFTCTSGGELGVATGDIGFDWMSRQGRPGGIGDTIQVGSFTVEGADSPVEVDGGVHVAFPAGSFTTGESFSLALLMPLVDGDRFSVNAETFDGYLVLRRSIEERQNQYMVIFNVSKCDSFEFFKNDQGEFDPYGERYHIDQGVADDQPGVNPDPDFPTVLNGFPYQYAVATYDMSPTHEQLLSPLEWTLVYPSAPPATTLDDVYVVPNPYTRQAGWDLDGAKLQFVNVPEGAVIRIYDAAGGYVDTVRPNKYSYDPSKQQGSVNWDLKNADGTEVVSGIYIYKLESDLGDKMGRFIIIR
jgi:hypothetical protein